MRLARIHWRTLNGLGFATDDAATICRAVDKRMGSARFFEMFSWRNEAAADIAHQTPEALEIWKPTETVLARMDRAVIAPVAVTESSGGTSEHQPLKSRRMEG